MTYTLLGGILGFLAFGMLESGHGQPALPERSVIAPAGAVLQAGEDKARDADREAIRLASRSFAQAFERGDAAKAAALLTSGAELIPDEDPPIRGRSVIQKAFTEYFAKHPTHKVTGEVESLRFLSRDSAIEEGRISIATGTQAPESQRYSILFIREDGKWLIGAIREWPSETAELDDLEWLIGTWQAKRADAEVHTTYEWLGSKAFIRGNITVREKNVSLTAMQLIGLDPGSGELKVWVFESDGGFAEGTCTRDGKVWTFSTSGLTADGGVLATTNILVRVNDDTITWQPINLTVDEEHVSNLPPVKVTRVKKSK